MSFWVILCVENSDKSSKVSIMSSLSSQFKWKTDEWKPFFQEGCFSIECIEGTFPLDLECKFHIACKAENLIKIDGNPFKF